MKGGDKGREGREEGGREEGGREGGGREEGGREEGGRGGISVKRSTVEHNTPTV